MKYEERVKDLRTAHRALAEKLGRIGIKDLPENVDKGKLERTYDKIASEYVLVLKKKSELPYAQA